MSQLAFRPSTCSYGPAEMGSLFLIFISLPIITTNKQVSLSCFRGFTREHRFSIRHNTCFKCMAFFVTSVVANYGMLTKVMDVKDESAEIYHDVLYYIINYSYKLNTEQCIKPYKYSVNYFFLHLMIITCKGILNLLFPVPTNSTTDKLNAQEVISAVAWDHGKCYLC